MSGMPEFDIVTSGAAMPPVPSGEVLAGLRFGSSFTNHMVTLRWSAEQGWHDGRVEPLRPLSIHPASAVLHYAQEIFEGMKAYRGPDGGALLFRPIDNARRFQRSAERLAMPILPEELFVRAVEELVRIDSAWIPDGDGALYLRPFMIATDVFLGVRPSSSYLFTVIAGPTGAYFKGGMKPISVWVSEHYSRAGKGGTGAAKCGGNYAASLVALAEAAAQACDQVVFLDAAEGRWVEELGGMNIFFVMADGTLVTPPLGTILDGITRDSVMKLARDAGHRVEERPYSFDEWRADAASGRLGEAFVCGTAAALASVGTVRHAGGDFAINGGEGGPVAARLREQLLAIQYGRAADPHGWRRSVPLDRADLARIA